MREGKVLVADVIQYGEEWTVDATQPVPGVLGNWEILGRQEVCLSGDTLIPLLNGTTVPIKQLVGRHEFWLYACSEDGQIIPGRGHSAHRTCVSTETVEVVLDDSSSFVCTPDHRVLLHNGSYRTADSLRPDASLMPLYRRRQEIRPGEANYEQVYQPGLGEWQFTHRIVMSDCPKEHVRHHADFNRFNNDPSNLIAVDAVTHWRLHADYIRKIGVEWNRRAVASGTHPFQQPRSEAQLQNARDRMIAYNKSDAHRRVSGQIGRKVLARLWAHAEFQAACRQRGAESLRRYNASEQQEAALKAWYDTEAGRAQRDRLAKRALAFNGSDEHLAGLARFNALPGVRAAASARMKNWRQRAEVIAAIAAHNRSPEGRQAARKGSQKALHLRWHVNRGITNPDCALCAAKNHKVTSVAIGPQVDVYDLSVDVFHNLAIGPGVFCQIATQ